MMDCSTSLESESDPLSSVAVAWRFPVIAPLGSESGARHHRLERVQ